MSDLNKAKDRMLKLLALARRGEGGEREKAQNLLNRMLTQHGLTLQDLERDDLPKQLREYSYRTEQERRLLRQIAAQVLNAEEQVESWIRRGDPVVIFELTDLEHLEMELRWTVYRTAWEHEQTRLLEAFIQAQKIFPERGTKRSTEELSAADLQDTLDILILASRITPVAVHRPLPEARKPIR